MKQDPKNFISGETMKKVNEKIEQELIEYLENEESNENPHNKKRGNIKFFLSIVFVIVLFAFIKLGPIIMSFLK